MSVDFRGVKTGDRVRLVYEFDVDSYVGVNYVTDGNWEYCPQNLVSVAVLEPPLPTEDGWYESERFPLSEDWSPYRISSGRWKNTKGEPVELSVVKQQAPWHRLVRETS